MATAVVYLRISSDPEGERAGVDRQRTDCLALVESRGWELVDVMEDNDHSAYRGKRRPGWEAAQACIGNGGVDYLVTWASDRLTRHPRELEDLVDLLEATGTQVVTETSGTYDLTTPEGRALARIVGAIARQESERKAERLKAANRHRAMQGRRLGGRRPFGFDTDGITVRDDEAAVYREMAHRVIDGDSIRSICRDLNTRRVLTASGGPWTNSRVTDVLKNPRYVAKRTYRGEVVADAEWPALLDNDTWQRLQAVLTQPERRWRGGPMKRWLTRVATCGRCGQPLVSGQVSAKRGASYTCSSDRGCNRLAIKAAWLEQYIEGLVVEVLSTNSARERFATHDVDENELVRINTAIDHLAQRLDEADRDYDDGTLDRLRWLKRTQRLTAQQQKLETDRNRMLRSSTVNPIPEGDVQAWWTELEPETKRRVARLLFTSVVVNPARNLGGKPDWERITVQWAA